MATGEQTASGSPTWEAEKPLETPPSLSAEALQGSGPDVKCPLVPRPAVPGANLPSEHL